MNKVVGRGSHSDKVCTHYVNLTKHCQTLGSQTVLVVNSNTEVTEKITENEILLCRVHYIERRTKTNRSKTSPLNGTIG